MSSTQKPELVRSVWPFRVEIEHDADRPTRVVVVDDHVLVAEILVAALGKAGLDAIAVGPDHPERLVDAIANAEPDVVLLDYLLGRFGTADDTVVQLTTRSVPVLVLTGVMDHATLGICLEAGACGVIQKQESTEALVEAIRRCVDGEPVLEPATRAEFVDAARRRRQVAAADRRRFARLTNREAEVLEHLCRGDAAGEIAELCFVAVSTVRSQIRSIFQKLEVSSQLEAVADAHRSGWFASRVTPEPSLSTSARLVGDRSS